MRIEKLWFIVIVLLVAYVIVPDVGIGTALPEDTLISVEPPASTGNVGQTFDINITVANVTDLYGWSINLTFNPGILNVEKVTEGPFLKEVDNTILLPPNIDNTIGFVIAGCMFLPPLPENGANGSGVLATITFEVKGSGETSLHFAESKLNTVVGSQTVPIQHTAIDGVFDNQAENNPPVALFDAEPLYAEINETITFNASASYDIDGWIVSYIWDFGDGNITTVDNVTTIITHAFATIGAYTVTLNATDNDGLTSINTKSVTIEKISSTLSLTLSMTSITIGENTTLSGFIDPVRSGVTVTIWYRPSGEETWNTVTTLVTGENGQYSYVWTPEPAGIYEIKAGWDGDENTFADETEVQEINVQEAAQQSDTAVPLYIIALIAAIVVAIIMITFYFMKTRKPT